MSLYKSWKAVLLVKVGLSPPFLKKVSIHLGSVLSSIFFSIVINILTEDMMELLYTDNLALCRESTDEVKRKQKWSKRVFERKGLRENVGKTKVMYLLHKEANVLKVDPHWVCGEQVVHNSAWCTKCQKCVYCCCLDVPRLTQFAFISEFACLQCLPGSYLLSNGKDKT